MSYGKLNNVTVSYDKKNPILKGLDLEIYEGELLSILGPSGCGKSTTLRAIAGFVDITEGEFILDGKDMTKTPIHKRDFGIVFQSYALFPHLTVFENVAFGLKLRKLPKEEIRQKVMSILEICSLTEFEKRYPANLSGGQRQRVALARALVIEPKLLLLDEPLSNLDANLRHQMRSEIRRIQKQLNITTIFVTHDQEECFAISDRVAIMNQGVIEQLGNPEEIFNNPKTEYIAKFVGIENFIDAKEIGLSENGLCAIRSKDIQIVENGEYSASVESIEFLGEKYKLVVNSKLGKLSVASNQRFEIGDEIKFDIDRNKINILEGRK